MNVPWLELIQTGLLICILMVISKAGTLGCDVAIIAGKLQEADADLKDSIKENDDRIRYGLQTKEEATEEKGDPCTPL